MKKILLGATLALTAAGASAADFFSTAHCDNLFSFGARLGVNTSNRTLKSSAFPDCYHHESWGTGFDVGFVAGLNIRDYLAIQPGVFFETRGGNFLLMGSAADSAMPSDGSEMAQAGTRRSYNITIPVLASFRFNLSDDIKWNVDAGPYVSFVLGSSLKNKSFVVDGPAEQPLFDRKPSGVDFGIKMGTGLQVLGHYYVGAHYLAGCVDAWKDRSIGNVTKTYGGITKAWVFTLGYDF